MSNYFGLAKKSQGEFEKEYKELEHLIGSIEKIKFTTQFGEEATQNDRNFKEINQNLTKEIYTIYENMERRISYYNKAVDSLIKMIIKVKGSISTLIGHCKEAIRQSETKKIEELITPDIREQLKHIKNEFFMKILRSILVGDDAGDATNQIYRTKLSLKERLLRKTLLAAEHYKKEIDILHERKEIVKQSVIDFMSKNDDALSIGIVQVSEDLRPNDIAKLEKAELFDLGTINFSTLKKKEKLLVAKEDALYFYDYLNSTNPSIMHLVKDIKQINIIQKNSNDDSNLVRTERGSNQHNYYFLVSYKSDKGGVILEIDSGSVKKWDYAFYIQNIIISNPILQDTVFRPFCSLATLKSLLKGVSIGKLIEGLQSPIENSAIDSANSYKIEDINPSQKIHKYILTSWKVIEECSLRNRTNYNRERDGVEFKNKTVQTEEWLLKERTSQYLEESTIKSFQKREEDMLVQNFGKAFSSNLLSEYYLGVEGDRDGQTNIPFYKCNKICLFSCSN